MTGAAAAVNVALNLILIPPYEMMGAAVATIAAYATMFVGMAWWAQRIYPVPYQWRRVVTAATAGVALAVAGKLLDANLAVALALALAYPLALAARSASTSRPSGARSARGYGRRARDATATTAASTCSGVFTIPGPSRT